MPLTRLWLKAIYLSVKKPRGVLMTPGDSSAESYPKRSQLLFEEGLRQTRESLPTMSSLEVGRAGGRDDDGAGRNADEGE